jgi:4-hydroxy-3-polyprenylbenzoate decarboxylase
MYKSLRSACVDLEKSGQLIRIKSEIDGNLEAAEIHRRVFAKGGPAILFEKIKGSPFQAVSNVYGTFDRTEYLFRDTIKKLKLLIKIKADPSELLKNPLKYLSVPATAIHALPMKKRWSPAVMYGKTSIDKLPLIKSWPMDGGAFVTMPQVMTLPPDSKDIMKSNLGMYRIQLNGNEYIENEEIGLHYQLHRGIGVHHQAYNKSDKEFKCSVFVGGAPSHAFSAIMPMPEGISELTFAGMLGGRRFRYNFDNNGHVLSSDADFVITGTIVKNLKKPEGPFGDHLGYYSLTHDFPVMKVENVYHRKDPLWHFSVVGRPPMEDSSFGYLIHELVGELIPQEFPGLVELNAVDAAGVHPLLLAIGKERYMPFRERVPEEILTIGNRILGSGQTSLAKYLIITDEEDDKNLSCHDIESYFIHVLQRIDWKRDLHFITKTTIDTLDYSGDGWNAGSKVIMACRGEVKRELSNEIPSDLSHHLIQDVKLVIPGVLAISTKKYQNANTTHDEMQAIGNYLATKELDVFPLIIVCDDPHFCSLNINNFVWVTFTRSNPSHDIYGVNSFVENKHWGCNGSLIIDARVKPHHAPVLVEDEITSRKVDSLFSKGGELYNII